MNGAHDLGGMHGFGTIAPEPEAEEPVFHAAWEKRVFGLRLAAKPGIGHGQHLIGKTTRLLLAFVIGLADGELGLRAGGAEDAANLSLLCFHLRSDVAESGWLRPASRRRSALLFHCECLHITAINHSGK